MSHDEPNLRHIFDRLAQIHAIAVEAREVRQQQLEHERRLMRLERVYGLGVMNTPIMITKLVVYALVLVALIVSMVMGKIDHAQMMTDISIVSGILIFALGLQGSGDRVGQAIANAMKAFAQKPQTQTVAVNVDTKEETP